MQKTNNSTKSTKSKKTNSTRSTDISKRASVRNAKEDQYTSYSYYAFSNNNGHTEERALNIHSTDGKHVSGTYVEKENNKKKVEKTFNNKDITKLKLTSK